MSVACCVYDFTDNLYCDIKLLKNWCLKYCKKWSFVGEQGTSSGRQHWQGRVSLKIKKRIGNIPNPLKFHFSVTSSSNKDNTFYIEKGDTAITPVYSDTDEVIYIPRQIREINSLYPWQETIISKLGEWDTRTINIVYCSTGNIGKSTLIGYCRAHRTMRVLPPVNDSKDLLRMVCDMPVCNAYGFDMPRAMNKDKLYGFYTAIETIKDGYAYDDRYHFKEKVFDCPNIWIFCNKLPILNWLSKDRWKIWEVVENELRPFEVEDF